MKSAWVFLALVTFSHASVQMGGIFGLRIITGEDTNASEIPYQVSLQNTDDTHFCGGTIVNKNSIITAAHCIGGRGTSNIKVIAGTTDLKDPQSVYLVTDIIVHPNYSPANSWVNDIALIRISGVFNVSKTISYVPLPERGTKVAPGSPAIVSGWGRLWYEGAFPTILQRVVIMIADHSYCRAIHTLYIYDTQICAFEPRTMAGSCTGDSGGPLTVNGTLVGLVSWGRMCASVTYPTIYTRVSAYLDWINSHVNC